MQLAPTEHAPAIRAFASISPEILVSQPIMIVGLCAFSFVSTLAPACPNCMASNGVSSSFATPLTPSVPNKRLIFLHHILPLEYHSSVIAVIFTCTLMGCTMVMLPVTDTKTSAS